MKSFLFATTMTLLGSCQYQFRASIQKTNSTVTPVVSEVMDFQVQRLSGSRVRLSWHAKPNQNDFLIMRRSGSGGIFEKVGIVKPKQSEIVIDYALTDFNECRDSSFYAIMQLDGRGVKYFSISRGVRGCSKKGNL